MVGAASQDRLPGSHTPPWCAPLCPPRSLQGGSIGPPNGPASTAGLAAPAGICGPCVPAKVYPGFWNPPELAMVVHWPACTIGPGHEIGAFTCIDCPCCPSPAHVLIQELLPALITLPCSYALCRLETHSEVCISALVNRCRRVLARVHIYSVPLPADAAATASLCIVYSHVAGDREASHRFFARLQHAVLGARRDHLERILRSRAAVVHIASAAAAVPAVPAPLAPLAPPAMLSGNSAAAAACRLVQSGPHLTPERAATLSFPALAAALEMYDPYGTARTGEECAVAFGPYVYVRGGVYE